MIEAILDTARASDYDFRKKSFPADPLASHFTDWLPYYRTKWAIARVLRPSSILEIGVRYGYSALAFLEAAPQAKYIGIDKDADSFGGSRGAIHWAKRITRGFHAEFLIADTQQLKRLPGGAYDLVHVDGQQDGDGTYHDMELALAQSKYVLVDGYFWTRQNFAAVNEFIYQHRKQVEFCAVIPGYAGELLIRMSDSPSQRVESTPGRAGDSLAVRDAYTADYYLNDCGGYQQFRANQGRALDDTRLRDVAAIAEMQPTGRVLDLGCGRGEIAYHFAKLGYSVTAVDYSSAAIALAQECLSKDPDLRQRVELINTDVGVLKLQGHYDLVIASDLIEHLAPAELDHLYANIAAHLTPSGTFVLHTFPNLWHYQYHYPKLRRAAAVAGGYLAPQPRSAYERLMHINEQSPRKLRNQLSRYFPHVILWFADPERPEGSLARRFSHAEMRAAPDLFAVASHEHISASKILTHLQTLPTDAITAENLHLRGPAALRMRAGQESIVKVGISNRSPVLLNSFLPNPFHLSYHWIDGKGVGFEVFEGARTAIWPALQPGQNREYVVRVVAPEKPDLYVLRLTLVQELVRWFDAPPLRLYADVSTTVAPFDGADTGEVKKPVLDNPAVPK